MELTWGLWSRPLKAWGFEIEGLRVLHVRVEVEGPERLGIVGWGMWWRVEFWGSWFANRGCIELEVRMRSHAEEDVGHKDPPNSFAFIQKDFTQRHLAGTPGDLKEAVILQGSGDLASRVISKETRVIPTYNPNSGTCNPTY